MENVESYLNDSFPGLEKPEIFESVISHGK